MIPTVGTKYRRQRWGGGRPPPALYLSVSPHMWPLREESGGGEMTRRESRGGEAGC